MTQYTPPTDRSTGAATRLGTLLDLVVLVFATGVAVGTVVLSGPTGGLPGVRQLLGFLLVFFFPGYAITAALFPRKHDPDSRRESGRIPSTLTTTERVVLSLGLSVAVVPLAGLSLTLLSVAVDSLSVLVTVGALTVTAAILAGGRRLKCHPVTRFQLPVSEALTAGRRQLTAGPLNVVLVVTMMLAVGGLGVAIVTASPGERYTEVALFDDGPNETLSPEEYPVTLSTNDTRTLTLEITNHERHEIEYTAVVLLQNVSAEGEIRESATLDRTSVTLAHGEQTQYDHDIVPPLTGDRLRLTYLVYVGDPPENPTAATAYRAVYLTVQVPA